MRVYRRDHAHRRDLAGGGAPPGLRRPEPGLGAAGPRGAADGRGAAGRVDRGLRRDARRQPRLPEARPRAPRPTTCAWPSSSAPRPSTLSGHDVSDEILAYARARNVTKIVVGKPTRPRWRRSASGSLVDELVRGQRRHRRLRHQRATPATRSAPARRRPGCRRSRPCGYACGRRVVGRLHRARLASMFPLLRRRPTWSWSTCSGVVFVATRCGRGPAIARRRS